MAESDMMLDIATNARLPNDLTAHESILFTQMEELLAEIDSETFQSLTTSSKERDQDEKSRLRRAKEASRRRVYRRAQKCGRDELRRQEEELSNELVNIQRHREKEKIRLEALRTPAFFVWKSFATQKMEERLYAEAEQRQLVAAVRAQAVYIDHMKTVLLKRNSIEFGSQAIAPKKQRQSTERELFKYLIQECDENFLRIDQVFEECGLNLLKAEAQVKSEKKRENDGEVEFYQQLMKIVQPFPLSDVSNSLWKAFTGFHCVKTDYENCGDVEDPENTCAISFRERISLATGEKIFVRQRTVLRRFNEANRVVFTWKFLSEGEGIFYGMHQEETGWCTLRPSSNSSEPGTVLSMCNHRNPLQFTSNSTSELNGQLKSAFHRFLEDIDEEAWGAIVFALEKLLIDDAFADIHPSPEFSFSV